MANNMPSFEIEPDNQPVQPTHATKQRGNVVLLSPPTVLPVAQGSMIWTPAFIALFVLVLALGLSMGSLLTQGWLNGYFAAEWVLLAYTVLNAAGWLAMLICTRRSWIRIGSGAGLLWTLLKGGVLLLKLLGSGSHPASLSYLYAAIACALLMTYLFLSSVSAPLSRWDIWLMRLTPVIAIAIVVGAFLATPNRTHTLSLLAHLVTLTGLGLCSALWLTRPSCWKTQAVPTLLFGLAPLLQLLAMQSDTVTPGNPFFFAQLALLLSLLAILCILQRELRR